MDRRSLLKGLISAIGVGAFVNPSSANDRGGLITRYGAEMPVTGRFFRPKYRTFYQTYSPFHHVAQETKTNVFLFHNLQKEIGIIKPHWQGPAPEDGAEGEGDCVGQAGAMGVDILAATDIHDLKQSEKWVAKASVEMAYAGSRVEVGKNQLDGRAGSHGEWMARFFKEFGVLHRIKYERDGQSLDLTGYHPGRARKYRDAGVPDWLEPIAKEHPVKEYTNVKSGAEALDAICARMPVLLCSSYAFENVRDDQGFAKAYLDGGSSQVRRGRRWFNFVQQREQWWHAMLLVGAILEGGRIGGIVLNSHGAWNSGPQPYDMPDGSFAVDLSTLDLIAKDWGDCWALGSYEGHKAEMMRHRLYR